MIHAWQLIRDAAAGLTDLFVPLRCAGCFRPGTSWCTQCAREIGGLRRIFRPLLEQCPPAYALGYYRSAARKAVLAFKEQGRRDLVDPFGAALGQALQQLGDGPWCLIPAPSRRIASSRRGGAHMLRVAQRASAVSGRTGTSVSVVSGLAMSSGTRDSVGLTTEQRVRNLAGRLSVTCGAGLLSRRPVVLIDDVITTGATAAACVDALASAGITVRAIVAVTATPR